MLDILEANLALIDQEYVISRGGKRSFAGMGGESYMYKMSCSDR